MAILEHVEIVRQGREVIKKWRLSNPETQLDLSGANLSGTDLTEAPLIGVNLRGADLYRTDFTMADLSGAYLTGANLVRASFTAANLMGTDFTSARFGFTCVSDCDFSQAKGLEKVKHVLPSSIGVDTLTKTLRGCESGYSGSLLKFFREAGVPTIILEKLSQLVGEIRYYSCFIAYGTPDQEFATRLVEDLAVQGVKCWFFPSDAKVGAATLSEERRGRQDADKVIVICSGAGLAQPGVKREIDETAQEDPKKLLPINKDGEWRRKPYVIERDGRNLKPFLENNVWADFASKSYEKALEDVLKGLEKLPPAALTLS